MQKPKIRISLSVINFKDKALKTWGLEEWGGYTDPAKHVLFFGLYTLHDFNAWYYSEIPQRSIFWCGSDILNVMGNHEFQRRLKLYPDTKHYCETKEEYDNLKEMGFEAEVIPSFLGDVKDFPLSYKPGNNVWMCAHPNREIEYGLDYVIGAAKELPDYNFHVYGIDDWIEMEHPENVIYHGNVTDEQLNKEIKEYQVGFRGNKHEGISEVVVKGALLGQHLITRMDVGGTKVYKNTEELINLLKEIKGAEYNKEGHEYWKNNINDYPWMK